jgi:hypothetical protein
VIFEGCGDEVISSRRELLGDGSERSRWIYRFFGGDEGSPSEGPLCRELLGEISGLSRGNILDVRGEGAGELPVSGPSRTELVGERPLGTNRDLTGEAGGLSADDLGEVVVEGSGIWLVAAAVDSVLEAPSTFVFLGGFLARERVG